MRAPALLAVFLACLPGPAAAELRAAMGKAEIVTPGGWKPVWIAGFGATGRRSRGARDKLYVRAVVV
ncbi:MAG TPA: hypothetical protein VNI01_10235, partial [Elusimicrobiota bacterium]|nr:hypothetical protein [Elusimicrobiota bacterium]